MTPTAMPVYFLPSIQWDDWAPTFLNFLHTIPGRNGVPLDYMCRLNVLPDRSFQDNILKKYTHQAPLVGKCFTTDASDVHAYLANLIIKNKTAEAKTQGNIALKNGQLNYTALRDHFQGVCINSLDILKAEGLLESLFYVDEKKPHMWWKKIETNLTSAFTTYDRK